MAFCKYCGNKLEDGELCTCEEAVAEARKAAEAASGSAQDAAEPAVVGVPDSAKTGAEAPGYPAPASDMGAAEVKADDSTFKKGIGLLAAAAAIIILIIILLASLLGGSYKTPLKKAVKGINKCDTELIMSAVLTDDQIEEIKEEAEDADEDYKDMIKDFDKLLEDATEVLEDEYFGKHMKVSYKITDKEKVSKKKELREIEDYYEDNDEEVKKAYKLKIELTVEGKDEEVESKLSVYSVKLKGGDWVLYADEDELTSVAEDFEEPIQAAGKKLTKVITKAVGGMGLGLGLGSDLDFDF